MLIEADRDLFVNMSNVTHVNLGFRYNLGYYWEFKFRDGNYVTSRYFNTREEALKWLESRAEIASTPT